MFQAHSSGNCQGWCYKQGDVNESVMKYETKHDFDSNLPYPFDAFTFFKKTPLGRGGKVNCKGAVQKDPNIYIALLDA